MQSSLYPLRREFIPPAPRTQEELDADSLWFKINDQSIVIGDVIHSDGLRTLVFSTEDCLEIISRAEYLHGDGTFKVAPYLWYQVFIMHASVGPNSVVPCLFALLPDKQRRSYDDLFSCLKIAIEKRELELSASIFISDFETNIRTSFMNYFPSIKCQGCFYHYGKAIWSRVKKGGVSRYYSSKSVDPKFGQFVRLVIGLPFVKINHLERGLNNIEKMSKALKTKECSKFAKEF